MLYRGGKRPSRAVQRTRRRRPVGGHKPVGLATAGGLAEIAAGVLGTVATWVASTGSRAAGREAQTPRGLREVGPWFFLGGALRCLACSESPSQKKILPLTTKPQSIFSDFFLFRKLEPLRASFTHDSSPGACRTSIAFLPTCLTFTISE
jgi:hypothetical protein